MSKRAREETMVGDQEVETREAKERRLVNERIAVYGFVREWNRADSDERHSLLDKIRAYDADKPGTASEIRYFATLDPSQREQVIAKAEACLSADRLMTEQLFDTGTISRKSLRPPFFVDTATGFDDSRGDGSQVRPVKTVGRAEALRKVYDSMPWNRRSYVLNDDTDYVKVKCDSTGSPCDLLVCNVDTCSAKVCREHSGKNFFDTEIDTYYFRPTVCHVAKCQVAYCPRHERRLSKQCDVCTNGSRAEVSLGCYSTPASYPLCSAHATTCTSYIKDYDGTPTDEVCGFVCCPNCIEDHECGNDPTEYC